MDDPIASSVSVRRHRNIGYGSQERPLPKSCGRRGYSLSSSVRGMRNLGRAIPSRFWLSESRSSVGGRRALHAAVAWLFQGAVLRVPQASRRSVVRIERDPQAGPASSVAGTLGRPLSHVVSRSRPGRHTTHATCLSDFRGEPPFRSRGRCQRLEIFATDSRPFSRWTALLRSGRMNLGGQEMLGAQHASLSFKHYLSCIVAMSGIRKGSASYHTALTPQGLWRPNSPGCFDVIVLTDDGDDVSIRREGPEPKQGAIAPRASAM